MQKLISKIILPTSQLSQNTLNVTLFLYNQLQAHEYTEDYRYMASLFDIKNGLGHRYLISLYEFQKLMSL